MNNFKVLTAIIIIVFKSWSTNSKLLFRILPTINYDIPDIRAGNYHVIVHYYQPYHPTFQLRVGTMSATRSGMSAIVGTLDLAYCPNLNGCRQAVKRSQRSNVFVLEEGTSQLRLEITGEQTAWIVSFYAFLFSFFVSSFS